MKNTSIPHSPDDLQDQWNYQFEQAEQCLSTIQFLSNEATRIEYSIKRYTRQFESENTLSSAHSLLQQLEQMRIEIYKMSYAINLHLQEMLENCEISKLPCKAIRMILAEFLTRFRFIKTHFYTMITRFRVREELRNIIVQQCRAQAFTTNTCLQTHNSFFCEKGIHYASMYCLRSELGTYT